MMRDTNPVAGTSSVWGDVLPAFNPNCVNLQTLHFETIEDMAEYGKVKGWHTSGHDMGEPGWHGAASYDAAVKIMHAGWPEGRAMAERIADRINVETPTAPRLSRYDVAGATCDVPRFLSGDPMHMKTLRVDASRKRPVVHLHSEIGGNWKIDAKSMSHRAGVVAAIVDRIEDAGFRVEVTIGYRFGNDRAENAAKQVSVVAGAKRAEDGLDLGRLVFAMGNPAMFRRIMFGAVGRDASLKWLGMGLGFHAGCPRDGERLTEANTAGTFILPSLEYNEGDFRTEDKAATAGLRFVVEHLRKQGCPGMPEVWDQAA